ncbi:MAG: hypothetical protein JXR94_17075, partial [Candidatus Hydrogenedentes bacterium]|nr:hypothetical protein [Candidatus Hydrogenedentota bacterium]
MLLMAPASAEPPQVSNPSFEEGSDSPSGWDLSGGQGDWLTGDAAEGNRAICVTGDGKNDNYWRSDPVAFDANTVYTLSFRARTIKGAGGTPTTGPIFANRDIWSVPESWKAYTSVFVTPRAITPDWAWLRFGQWHVNGTIAFDQLELRPAQPIHRRFDGVELGKGEQLKGNEYAFEAPFAAASTNYSRPLAGHHCGFNTNRWVFGADSQVVYCHAVGDRQQTSAEVAVGVGYYVSGALDVEVSADGTAWQTAGSITGLDEGRFTVPAGLLPARTIWIRLSARAKERVGAGSDPGSFQVNTYSYHAVVDGAPADLYGETDFIAVHRADPRLDVAIESIGDGLPGGENVVIARVENRTDSPIRLRPRVTLSDGAGTAASESPALNVEPGSHQIRFPYTVPDAGAFDVSITLGKRVDFEAVTAIHVPALCETAYGERLPGSNDELGLWWASSGWKIARTRPLPEAKGRYVSIRAARNEAEAAQLVVRPERDLSGLLAQCGPLAGPRGAQIPAECVEVLRVRYVDIAQQTDPSGMVAPWPDPLPPFSGPIDVPAGTNQPLWVRVTVPDDAEAGVYSGTIHVTADGLERDVPLRVEVYGFALPDRMTCVSAFGFSPGNVFQYQRVTDPAQQREVLDKYWESFSAHHISPYNPAPLDPIGVEWTGLASWTGGQCDTSQKHGGEASLLLRDDSPSANVAADCTKPIAIPEGGVRIRFWHRSETDGHQGLVTLSHQDAAGQWMSGRNNDMAFACSRDWQLFDKTITRFPDGARTVTLALRATLWREDGSSTGAIWYDDLSVQDAGTGQELVEGGGFEPVSAMPEPVFDWTAWDRAMERAMGEYHFNAFQQGIPGLGGGTFHSRNEPSLLGYGEETPEYKAAFGAYCRKVEAHLKEKGWLDEAYVYWFDEPDPKDYEFVMNGFRKLKENAPGIGRMLTEQIEPELIGGPNIWCPLTPSYNHEQAEERRKAGDEFWWYVCCGPKAPFATLFIDHPATELRVWLWQTWKRRIDGILVWQTNYWTSTTAYPEPGQPQDPYADPMSWRVGYGTPKGVKSPWGNG